MVRFANVGVPTRMSASLCIAKDLVDIDKTALKDLVDIDKTALKDLVDIDKTALKDLVDIDKNVIFALKISGL